MKTKSPNLPSFARLGLPFIVATLAAGSAVAADLTWRGTGPAWISTNAWTDSGGSNATFNNGDNVWFTDSGLGDSSAPITATHVNVGNMTVSNTTGNYSIGVTTFTTGTLTGTTLTKSGAGTLSFDQTGQAIFGSTVLNGGTLALRQGSGNGFSGGAITISGPTTVTSVNTTEAAYLKGTSLSGTSELTLAPNTTGAAAALKIDDVSGFTGTIKASAAGTVQFEAVSGTMSNFSQAKVVFSGNTTLEGRGNILQIGELTVGSSNVISSRFGTTYQVGALGTASSIAGTIQNGLGTTVLTKVGSGTLTLTGANTYTGATTVNAGTLLLGNGASGSITSAVTVNEGAFYGNLSSGNITTSAVTIGDSTGTADSTFGAGQDSLGRFVSSGALTLRSDANFVFDLHSGTELTDVATFGGAVFLGGTFTLNDLNTGAISWTVGDSFTVVSGASRSGTFSNLANNAILSVDGVDYQATYNGTSLILTVTSVIPEPSSMVLAIVGGISLFCAARRREA